MTTTLQIVDMLFAKLDGSALKTEITGAISKHVREGNSDKEDVVINCLPINNEQLQKAVANVNIHVPDVVVDQNGMQNRYPNHARLSQLTDIAIGILDDTWGTDYNYDIQQHVLIEDREAGSHYSNIRIEIYFENL